MNSLPAGFKLLIALHTVRHKHANLAEGSPFVVADRIAAMAIASGAAREATDEELGAYLAAVESASSKPVEGAAASIVVAPVDSAPAAAPIAPLAVAPVAAPAAAPKPARKAVAAKKTAKKSKG